MDLHMYKRDFTPASVERDAPISSPAAGNSAASSQSVPFAPGYDNAGGESSAHYKDQEAFAGLTAAADHIAAPPELPDCRRSRTTRDQAPLVPPPLRQTVVKAPSKACGWHAAAPAELAEAISCAIERERTEPPLPPFDGDGPYGTGDTVSTGGSANGATAGMRAAAIGWLAEVAAAFALQQETLFLAAALLDRFMAAARVPPAALQLAAVAALLVACKGEEAGGGCPSVEALTDVAAGVFQARDLLRAERLLLSALDWRLRPPTAYAHLHLLAQALCLSPRAALHGGGGGAQAAARAAYLCELSLLDARLIPARPSAVAAAALLVAGERAGGGGGGGCFDFAGAAVATELRRLTGYTLSDLEPIAARLLQLQAAAADAAAAAAASAAADAAAAAATPSLLWCDNDKQHARLLQDLREPLAFIHGKYARPEWLRASATAADSATHPPQTPPPPAPPMMPDAPPRPPLRPRVPLKELAA